jgi:hypothetical protein
MLFTGAVLPKKKVNMKIAVDYKNMMYLFSLSLSLLLLPEFFPKTKKIFFLPSYENRLLHFFVDDFRWKGWFKGYVICIGYTSFRDRR